MSRTPPIPTLFPYTTLFRSYGLLIESAARADFCADDPRHVSHRAFFRRALMYDVVGVGEVLRSEERRVGKDIRHTRAPSLYKIHNLSSSKGPKPQIGRASIS